MNRRDKGWTRIVLEKPFGRDLESANVLNDVVQGVFDEKAVYRIDHYLGKEIVQNILVFRFSNSLLEPVWNRNYIDYVEITATETVGVENRAAFYEEPIEEAWARLPAPAFPNYAAGSEGPTSWHELLEIRGNTAERAIG